MFLSAAYCPPQSFGVPDFVRLPVLVVRSWVFLPRLVCLVFPPIEVRRRVEIWPGSVGVLCPCLFFGLRIRNLELAIRGATFSRACFVNVAARWPSISAIAHCV